MKPNAIDVLSVVVVGVGWGLLAPANKALFAGAPGVLDGVTVAVARGLFSLPPFALMLLWAAWRERPRLALRQWLAVAGAGLCFGLGIVLTLPIAAEHTSIAHITFLIGASPVTNSLAAALAFRLPIDRRQRVALALGVVGIGLLALSKTGNGAELFGDLLMLVWLAAFAVYAVLLRCVGPGVSSTFAMSAIGVVAMVAVVAAGTFRPASFAASVYVLDSPAASAWFLGEIVLGSTLIAQTVYTHAVHRLGIAVATIGAEYTAVAVGIAASLVVREAWTVVTVAAGTLLVVALAVTFAPARPLRVART